MKTFSDIDVAGKRVFVRADLDVPLESVSSNKYQVSSLDSTRLQNLKPTVEYLLEQGAKQIIIAGHIDRPQKPDPAFSTEQLAQPLEAILHRSVVFKSDIAPSEPGTLPDLSQLVLLENLRFWKGEEANDPEFAKSLARLADVYVNESFAVSHRAHASLVGLSALLPHAAGIHLEKEVEELSRVLEKPDRPFVVIIGGEKIETKIPVIENLAKIADHVLVGGLLPKEIREKGLTFADNVHIATLTEDGKDIDADSQCEFSDLISSAKLVVWNGPMGYFEGGFETGSLAILEVITSGKAYSIVGGGDTEDFLARHNGLSRISFVSVGGGAMLEFLAGKKLPGIEALE